MLKSATSKGRKRNVSSHNIMKRCAVVSLRQWGKAVMTNRFLLRPNLFGIRQRKKELDSELSAWKHWHRQTANIRHVSRLLDLLVALRGANRSTQGCTLRSPVFVS